MAGKPPRPPKPVAAKPTPPADGGNKGAGAPTPTPAETA
jgi:hypothetical protein